MARIKPVSSAQAGPHVKIAYHFTRRSIGKLTGRETKNLALGIGSAGFSNGMVCAVPAVEP